MRTTTKARRQRDQRGMVSIMVTLILMLVISLIVLGFAQISRREQRQALDRQLSMQAFLAAESGVNDAREGLMAAMAAGVPSVDKDDCETVDNGDPNNPYSFNPVLDAANGVSYTCLLVDTKVRNVTAALAAGGQSVNVPLHPDSGTIRSLRVNWSLPVQPTNVNDCANYDPGTMDLPSIPSADWECPYGILRLDLVPTTSYDRAAMTAGQKTMFLYPTKGGPETVQYNDANGAVAKMRCTNADGCNIEIQNMPASVSQYNARLSSIYAGGVFDIRALDSSNTELLLKDAQAVIDSTGKAQDVLRRVQVRLSLVPGNKYSDYALVSGSSLCKRFSVDPASFIIAPDIIGQDTNNPMCRPVAATPPPPPPPPPPPTSTCTEVVHTFTGDIAVNLVPHEPQAVSYAGPLSAPLKKGCRYDMTLVYGDIHDQQAAGCAAGNENNCRDVQQPEEWFYLEFRDANGLLWHRYPRAPERTPDLPASVSRVTVTDVVDLRDSTHDVNELTFWHPRRSNFTTWNYSVQSIHIYSYTFTPR